LITKAEVSPSLRGRVASSIRPEAIAAGCGAAIALGGIGAASGGYFASSWGWAALALAWAAALALLLRADTDLGTLDVAFFGSLTLFVGWIWLSTAWSHASPQSVLEGERGLIALTGAGAALLVVSRRTVPQLLGGVAAAIALIAAYGLATRLFPNHLGTFDPIARYRLEAPIGYWNALGIFSTIGALLCLSFAARGTTYVTRALAGGAISILLPTLYFTYSRGSWIALGIGLVSAILLDPRRLQLVTALALLAPVAALEVWLGSRKEALTHRRTDLAAAVHDGKRYALIVLVSVVLTGVLAVVLALVERRAAVPRAVRVAYGGTLALIVLAGLVVVFMRYGSPAHIASNGWRSFKSSPSPVGSNLNRRLFSFSGNGRVDVWRVAWHDYRANPMLGAGAGTYGEYWLAHRPNDLQVKDAHSLYLETLAELGPVGLVLLALALVVPLGAGVVARAHPLVPAGFGAYVAYLGHAAIDWDWEVTAVTLAALLVGVALIAAARRRRPWPLAARLRGVLVTVAVAIAALSFVVLVGNLKLARANGALARHDWSKAAAEASSARDWAPWSSQTLKTLGEAQLQLGQTGRAAATFRKALGQDPRNSDLWYGLYLATAGAAAERAFATSVRLNPYGFEADVRRAVVPQKSG
jgi:hypothetical protein